MFVTSSGDANDLTDGRELRRTAVGLKVPICTTVAGIKATACFMRFIQEETYNASTPRLSKTIFNTYGSHRFYIIIHNYSPHISPLAAAHLPSSVL